MKIEFQMGEVFDDDARDPWEPNLKDMIRSEAERALKDYVRRMVAEEMDKAASEVRRRLTIRANRVFLEAVRQVEEMDDDTVVRLIIDQASREDE